MNTCPHCGNDLPDPKSVIRRCVHCGRTLSRHDGLLCAICQLNGQQVTVSEQRS